jgi:hypothetical protein
MTDHAGSSTNGSCEMWGSNGDVYEEFRPLWCDAVWLLLEPMFRRNNLHFGRTYHLHIKNGKNQRDRNNVISALQFLVTANVFPNSLILSSLKMEATRSSEKSAVTRVLRRHIPGDGFLNNQRRENHRSCTIINIFCKIWSLHCGD